MKICLLDASALDQARPQLVDLLLDAGADSTVDSAIDTAVGHEAAQRYWDEVSAAVEAGTRLLLAASHRGELLGSVQLDLCQQPNGHRFAELQQLMVQRRARRRGLGGVLLRAAEAEAGLLGRGLLFLDLEAGCGAEQLYHGYGYTCVGAPPDACIPGAIRPAKATYYKSLLPPAGASEFA
jgi:acetyltransferase